MKGGRRMKFEHGWAIAQHITERSHLQWEKGKSINPFKRMLHDPLSFNKVQTEWL